MFTKWKQFWAWAYRKSKDSVTHLFANVVLWLVAIVQGAMFVLQFIDDETRAQIVSVVGEHNVHIASIVAIVLMLGTKMSRDHNINPFNSGDPH